MTRIELIELIGDVLTQLDVLIGSMSPSDPDRTPFITARKQLDKLQLSLAQQVFDDNTKKYKDAAAELEKVNNELQKIINDLEKIVKTLETINRFIGAVDKIIQAVLP